MVWTEKGVSLSVELGCRVFHGGVRAALFTHATHDAVGNPCFILRGRLEFVMPEVDLIGRCVVQTLMRAHGVEQPDNRTPMLPSGV